MEQLGDKAVHALIQLALAEDVGSGDVTTQATIEAGKQGQAYLLARERCLFCSHAFVEEFCRFAFPSVRYFPEGNAASYCESDSRIGSLRGPMRDLLTLERTLLNFVQRLSGIASHTAALVAEVASQPVSLLDTRKTTPGWRLLEKYAVAFAGGTNHRTGLYDAFLIKNNHVDALGGDVAEAIRRCRSLYPDLPLEVEVRSQVELAAALSEKPDWILLDNMTPNELREAVVYVDKQLKETAHRPKLEASGGIRPESLLAYAASGVDALSMGWLTHSVPAVDISLRFEKESVGQE